MHNDAGICFVVIERQSLKYSQHSRSCMNMMKLRKLIITIVLPWNQVELLINFNFVKSSVYLTYLTFFWTIGFYKIYLLFLSCDIRLVFSGQLVSKQNSKRIMFYAHFQSVLVIGIHLGSNRQQRLVCADQRNVLHHPNNDI